MTATPDTRVTSTDVARAAGCSQSTVSLVLSGKAEGRVSAATAEAVRAAAQDLGYRPNSSARALRSGSTRTVGLVVPDVTNPFLAAILRGAQGAARRTGHVVALLDTDNDAEQGAGSFAALRAAAVDGVLLFGGGVEIPDRRDPFFPVVVVEQSSDALPFVRLDIEHGVRAALEHLLALGHKRIGHLRADIDAQTFHRRVAAMAAGYTAAGLDPATQPSAPSLNGFLPARDAARALLTAPDPPTAIVCDDDLMAGGVYLAARELGLRIPQDVSVVGFDDLPYTVVLDPSITTVRADALELGAQAFGLLAEALAGGTPVSRVVAVSLVVRGSTGPPTDSRPPQAGPTR